MIALDTQDGYNAVDLTGMVQQLKTEECQSICSHLSFVCQVPWERELRWWLFFQAGGATVLAFYWVSLLLCFDTGNEAATAKIPLPGIIGRENISPIQSKLIFTGQ